MTHYEPTLRDPTCSSRARIERSYMDINAGKEKISRSSAESSRKSRREEALSKRCTSIDSQSDVQNATRNVNMRRTPEKNLEPEDNAGYGRCVYQYVTESRCEERNFTWGRTARGKGARRGCWRSTLSSTGLLSCLGGYVCICMYLWAPILGRMNE